VAQDAPAAFFSYSRDDSEFALRLAADLKTAGGNVWIDQLDIVPGQRWDRAIEDALGACSCLLVILSPASVNSTNVMDEVSFALEEQRTLIPVLYKECQIPFRLRRLQHLDFRVNYARGLRELLTTLAIGPRTPPGKPAVLSVAEPAAPASKTPPSAEPEPPAIRRDDRPPEQPMPSRPVTTGVVHQKVEPHPESSSPIKFALIFLGVAALAIVALLVFSAHSQSPPSQQSQRPVSAHDRALKHYMLAAKATTTDGKISQYREALSEEPNNADIHYQLADLLAGSGGGDAAATEYREVIRLRPGDMRAYLQLADLLLSRKGEWKAAIAELRDTVKVFPNNPEPHAKLAFALEQNGNSAAALEQYRLCESKPHPSYYDFPECQAGDKRLSANPAALKAPRKN